MPRFVKAIEGFSQRGPILTRTRAGSGPPSPVVCANPARAAIIVRATTTQHLKINCTHLERSTLRWIDGTEAGLSKPAGSGIRRTHERSGSVAPCLTGRSEDASEEPRRAPMVTTVTGWRLP